MRQYMKLLTGVSTLALAFSLVGCGELSTSTSSTIAVDAVASIREYDNSQNIKVVSREDGSGTRKEFLEAFDIVNDDSDFEKDPVYEKAIVAHESSIAAANVVTNGNAIAYISLGEVDESVKVLSIDNVEPTIENIENGSYRATRPFMLATTEDKSELAKDFEKYILSQSGKSIIGEHYAQADGVGLAFQSEKVSGTLIVGGSSSMAPLMQELIAGYQAVNTNAEILLEINNSSKGIQGVIDGVYDIGMTSRELLRSETYFVETTTIAKDGIAVVVSTSNPIDNLSSEEVKKIYTGIYRSWSLMELVEFID